MRFAGTITTTYSVGMLDTQAAASGLPAQRAGNHRRRDDCPLCSRQALERVYTHIVFEDLTAC